MSAKKDDLTEFIVSIKEGERLAKGPDLFWRSLDEETAQMEGELCILRRWNSHIPAVFDVLGGGYFLRWHNRGTVIDPGCAFIKLYRNNTGYNLGHIDMVITTHDHVDHCQDLGTLISLYRQYNKWCVTNRKPLKQWSMMLSYGVVEEYSSMLNHPDNSPFLSWQKVHASHPTYLDKIHNVPDFLSQAIEHNLLDTDGLLSSLEKEAEIEVRDRFHYRLQAIPCNHREVSGATTAFGLRFDILNAYQGVTSRIVISGDTAINRDSNSDDGSDLAEYYSGADLLILHLGGIEEAGSTRYKGDHLGLSGVVEILSKLDRKPQLVILTEWGYEFGRLGMKGRTSLTKYVVERLHAVGCYQYYAAVKPNIDEIAKPLAANIPIIPADICLRVRLPDLAIRVVNNTAKGEPFRHFKEIYADESLESIYYYGRE
jgi:ribonuclease BN (tRNA processing enzyme)